MNPNRCKLETHRSIIRTGRSLYSSPRGLAGMAPEVARNEAYNSKADIYSFGIILLELVKRDLPYSNDDRRKGKLLKLCKLVLLCWLVG